MFPGPPCPERLPRRPPKWVISPECFLGSWHEEPNPGTYSCLPAISARLRNTCGEFVSGAEVALTQAPIQFGVQPANGGLLKLFGGVGQDGFRLALQGRCEVGALEHAVRRGQ